METITFKPFVELKLNKNDLSAYYNSVGIVDFPKSKNGEPNMTKAYNKTQLALLTNKKKEEILKKYETYIQEQSIKKQMEICKSKKIEVETKTENCPVCYDPITTMSVLKCGHAFCVPCTISHFREGDSCPLCRVQICEKPVKKSIMPPQMSHEIITQLLNKQEPERLNKSMEKYIEQRLVDFKRNPRGLDSMVLTLEFCNEINVTMMDLAEAINQWYE
jgi:hypothetical protein